MLKLTNITKDYVVANNKVHALKGISISFRNNEFVSILGPSGCGKTTLLNIIGGLDHYTTGDLIIDNISTKNYSDRDWDTYRNHRIGFIFQSYNLIPHQTILENVELALTIAGMGKEERIQKAKEALDKVGLQGEYNKKPNQLSGGQCQRVAIARALVNEPDILLADEPTGALDTKTSIQIMDLIKEISKNRLVIMVTHNPDIADKYSTRIVTLLDGVVTSDSNPLNDTEEKSTKPISSQTNAKDDSKKSKLSFLSAFKLSARNLRSKFKRTAMVCIAGSIGIIGVASVLSLSTGVRSYINDMQEDMLSGNPIQITEEAMNLDLLMETSSQTTKQEALKESIKNGYVDVDSIIDRLISSKNDFESLKISNNITEDYIQFLHDMPKSYYSSITSYYGIDVSNNIYTDIDLQGEDRYKIQNRNLSLSAIISMYTSMLEQTDLGPYSGYIATLSNTFNQAVENESFIAEQYDIISSKEKSKIATEANEIMIVVNENTQLTDLLLAQLGYFSQSEFFNIIYTAIDSVAKDTRFDKPEFSYDELLNKKFVYYPNTVVYTEKSTDDLGYASAPFTYHYEVEDSMKEEAVELKITAILRPKKGTSYGCLQSGIYYTPKFTQKYLKDSQDSRVVQYLVEHGANAYTSIKSSLGYTPLNAETPSMIYSYNYYFEGQLTQGQAAVGNTNAMTALLGIMMGGSNPTSQISTYTLTLREIGGLNRPNAISIYPKDFTLKDSVTNYLKKWNSQEDITLSTNKVLTSEEREEIIYTDSLSIVIAIINEMINMITIALVAFTALSLVVSTVMIAIITYVSVIERIKEIGVIRSLGGRKKDVSRLFTAESFIIGGLAGVLGITVTYLLTVIVNAIVRHIAPIPQIAKLTLLTAVIMVAISITLTLISGLIPARIASKKDPVDALRTE